MNKNSVILVVAALVFTASAAVDGAELKIRPANLSPYADLDTVFETDNGNGPWGSVAKERAELEAMAALSKATVEDRLAARKAWYTDFKAHCGPSSASKASEKCAIYRRNFHSHSAKKPILSGRAVHFKTVGCFLAEVSVNAADKVSDAGVRLDRGIFSRPHRYQAIVRFSNGSSRFASDREPSSYGMTVKLLRDATYDFNDASVANARHLNDDATVLNMSNINAFATFMYNPPQYRRILEQFGKVLDAKKGVATPGRDQAYRKQALTMLGTAVLFGNSDTDIDLRTLALIFASKGHLPTNPLFQDYDSLSAFRLGQADGSQTAVKYLFEQARCDAAKGGGATPMAQIHDSAFGREVHPPFTLNLKPTVLPGRLINLLRNSADTDAGLKSLFSESLSPDPFADVGLTQAQLKTVQGEDFLRRNAEAVLGDQPVCYKWKLHPYLNQQDTPTDDATVTWMQSEQHRSQLVARWTELNAKAGVSAAVGTFKSASHFPISVGLKQALSGVRKGLGYDENAGSDSFASAKRSLGGAVGGLQASVSAPAPMNNRKPSPPVEVGEITLLRQGGGLPGIDPQLCEQLSFSVWDNVPLAHKPIGRVNRMRWFAYRASRQARQAGVPGHLGGPN